MKFENTLFDYLVSVSRTFSRIWIVLIDPFEITFSNYITLRTSGVLSCNSANFPLLATSRSKDFRQIYLPLDRKPKSVLLSVTNHWKHISLFNKHSTNPLIEIHMHVMPCLFTTNHYPTAPYYSTTWFIFIKYLDQSTHLRIIRFLLEISIWKFGDR